MTGIYRGAKPRVRVERSTGLSQMMSSFPEPYAIAVLARVLYDASWSAIGKRLGVDEDEARSHYTGGVLRLRRQSTAAEWEILRSDAGQGEVIDEGLRILIRKWRLDEFAPVCAQCGRRCKPVVLRLLTLHNKGGALVSTVRTPANRRSTADDTGETACSGQRRTYPALARCTTAGVDDRLPDRRSDWRAPSHQTQPPVRLAPPLVPQYRSSYPTWCAATAPPLPCSARPAWTRSATTSSISTIRRSEPFPFPPSPWSASYGSSPPCCKTIHTPMPPATPGSATDHMAELRAAAFKSGDRDFYLDFAVRPRAVPGQVRRAVRAPVTAVARVRTVAKAVAARVRAVG